MNRCVFVFRLGFFWLYLSRLWMLTLQVLPETMHRVSVSAKTANVQQELGAANDSQLWWQLVGALAVVGGQVPLRWVGASVKHVEQGNKPREIVSRGSNFVSSKSELVVDAELRFLVDGEATKRVSASDCESVPFEPMALSLFEENGLDLSSMVSALCRAVSWRSPSILGASSVLAEIR